MSSPVTIECADDPRVNVFRDVINPHAPARLGYVLAEGTDAVRWLLESDKPTTSVVCKPSMLPVLQPGLHHQRARGHRVEVFLADQGMLSQITGLRFKRGCIAVAPRPALRALDTGLVDVDASTGFIVCDGVHDPANLGAIIRSARCLGLSGAVLLPGCGPVVSPVHSHQRWTCLSSAAVCCR